MSETYYAKASCPICGNNTFAGASGPFRCAKCGYEAFAEEIAGHIVREPTNTAQGCELTEPMQNVLDTIESAITLDGMEVMSGNAKNEIIAIGNENYGVNYRITVETVAK